MLQPNTIVRKKYKEKIGVKKLLRLPIYKISGNITEKKQLYFHLIREYFLLTSIKYKLKLKFQNNDLLNNNEQIEDIININQLFVRNQLEINKKFLEILKLNQLLKVSKNTLMSKPKVPFFIERRLPSYKIKGGELAGLINQYYKLYDYNYLNLIGRRSKKIKRKNHFGNIRRYFKDATIKTYLAQFVNLGTKTASYAHLVKNNKLKLVNILFALKFNKKIPPKYKKIRRYTLKLARPNLMRFQKLIIPEFDFWSTRVLQQINGEY